MLEITTLITKTLLFKILFQHFHGETLDQQDLQAVAIVDHMITTQVSISFTMELIHQKIISEYI